MMHSTQVDASVIICAYTESRWQYLVAAVESLRQQQAPPREIIVVIDHNLRLFERAQQDFADVIVVENMNAQGLSGARNTGIALAQGAFIAFLDDDAVAEKDWLVRLCQHCADPSVLGVGGTVEPLWLGALPSWFPREFYWVVGCTYQDIPQTPLVVRNPYGGCACYRRELFKVVGGFRSEMGRGCGLPLGCEETELCIRAQQYWPQKVFLYEPRARIHHCVPPTRTNWRYFRDRCYAEGLSKAAVTRYVGAQDGLKSEQAYVRRTIPRGVVRGLADGFLRFDLTGFVRAGMLLAGLAITTSGYLMGSLSLSVTSHQEGH